IDDRALLVLAIVGNVQRADLSPPEEADACRRPTDEFADTQKGVAESVGRARSTGTTLLRRLQLPASAQLMVTGGELSLGHARALLGLPDNRQMAELGRRAAKEGLSVRAVEEQVRRRQEPAAPRRPSGNGTGSAHVRRLESELQRA